MTAQEESFFDKEVAELGELIEAHEQIVDMTTPTPYKPNRAQRRSMAKRDRALQKRNLRG